MCLKVVSYSEIQLLQKMQQLLPMYMKDCIKKLDDFLTLSGKKLLTHAGSISAEVAKLKADTEYDKFRERTQYQLSPVEIHFIEAFEAEQKKLKR